MLDIAELERQLYRYQGGVEVEWVYIMVVDDNGYEATAIEVNWNPDVIGQRVRVLVLREVE